MSLRSKPTLLKKPVRDDDPRLVDPRVPLVHGHSQAEVTGLGTAAVEDADAFDPAGAANAAQAAAAADATSKANAAQAAAAADATSKANAAQAAAAADATSKANAAQAAAEATAEGYTDSVAATKADLVGGVVPSSQIPAIAVTEYLGSVASQAAMLALVGQKGDWCVRSDLSKNAIITGNDPTQISSWTLLEYPGAPVTSVNGQTGAVSLNAANVGAAPTSHGTHVTPGGIGTAELADNGVTNPKLADMAQGSVKGRAAGAGTGDPTDLTGVQVAAILPTVAQGQAGLAPAIASTPSATRVLSETGWKAEAAGGSAPATPDIWTTEPVMHQTNLHPLLSSPSAESEVTKGDVGSYFPVRARFASSIGALGHSVLIGPKLAPDVDGVSRFAISSWSRTSNVLTVVLAADPATPFARFENLLITGITGATGTFNTKDSNPVKGRVLTFDNVGSNASGGAGGYIVRHWASPVSEGLIPVTPTHPLAVAPHQGGSWVWDLGTRYAYNPTGIATGISGSNNRMLVSRSRTSNVATLETATAHGYAVDEWICVLGAGGTGYDTEPNLSGWAMVRVISVPSSTTFTYASTGANEGTTAISALAGTCMRAPLPGVYVGEPAEHARREDSALKGRTGIVAGNPWYTGLHYGSFGAAIKAFFVASAGVQTLPESGRFMTVGQVASGNFGYWLCVDSAGTLTLRNGDGAFPGSVRATLSGATVAAGDSVQLSKFGNQWSFCITSGNNYGTPKNNAVQTWWKRAGIGALGYDDIFGETCIGVAGDSVSGTWSYVRFAGGG